MSQHIVIVEDDSVTRRRLAAALKKQMYRVSEAEDAAQMEAILARDPADLLLVDINLDGKDGLTITREQRALSTVGIILLTSRDDQVDRIVGLEMGADDYVTKPFDMQNPGIVLSRERLIEMVQHRQATPEDRTIDVLIGRLRRKIETDPSQPDWIITVHGEGYLFAPAGS
ncbi:MAG: two-component system response regulator TorR [Rhodobacterales bacterium]|nr:MAG: two-component system response regulator TorR [Rhodobacterales bacterium]